VFDSTLERNLPFRFELGDDQVMHGWEAAVPHLSLGSVSELTIPAAFAYGADGFPPYVPPHAVLIYKIQLLEIVKTKKNNKPTR
jgi:FKBP-type peptidyl-prolyl cis-trans isomerase